MDYKAVRNTIKYNITNGITEGFVNKLKVVKRVMYGRAGYWIVIYHRNDWQFKFINHYNNKGETKLCPP